MLLLESYVNLLKTDIVDMLDQSVDRTKELDEHIAILKEYYTKTSERMNILAEQYRDLQALLKNAVETTGIAKVKMEEKYR